jgi:hypothetical protein
MVAWHYAVLSTTSVIPVAMYWRHIATALRLVSLAKDIPMAADLSPVVSTLEKLALSFVSAHPDLLSKFVAHATGNLVKDVATKHSVTLDPAVQSEIETAVAEVLTQLVPIVLSAAAGK